MNDNGRDDVSHNGDASEYNRRMRSAVEALQYLTERETVIVRHIGNGLPLKSIARRLKISENTLDNHKTRVLRKLGLHRLADLVRFAIGSGLSKINETNCFPPEDESERL